jgi:glutamyl-tRNA synthetase
MHLGNVFSALLSWLSARSQGGRWLLRIEDIDRGRSRQAYADLLMDDLEWLGLTLDGEPVYQSQRSDIYEHYFQELRQRGLTYPCYCTRADLLAAQAPHESDGRVVYPGTCRQAPRRDGVAAATRLMVPDEWVTIEDGHYGTQSVDMARDVGDFIIRRKDGGWAYQLVVGVDDALMGVTEVVRGQDLLLSAPQQAWLARLLGFEAPRFVHLPLLCNQQGQRLSKRDQSLDMASLRERYTAKEMVGRLAYHAGLIPQPEPTSPQDVLAYFDWNKVPKENIIMS